MNEFTSGPPQPRPDPTRFPFSVVDEAVHLLETEAAPWSVQMELAVEGHLDEARLRGAFAQALGAHPMARARKVASRPALHTDEWEIAPLADHDPLRVVECVDDGALATTRAELQSLAVPLAEAPPLRARLARHPGGDIVMLNANHAAMDGFGALRLLQSARFYNDEPDPTPTPSPLEAREYPDRLASGGFLTRMRRRLALAEKLRDVLTPPARVAPDGATGAAGYGFHHVSLSASETEALMGLDHAGTVNDVLVSALHLAVAGWNSDHGEPCGRIGVLVPPTCAPTSGVTTSWATSRCPPGCPPRPATGAAPKRPCGRSPPRPGARRSRVWVRLWSWGPGGARKLPLWAKQAMVALMPLTGNRLVDTAMLSNMGHLPEPPSFGADAGGTVDVWFSPPGRMPLGLTIGAVTVDRRLHLSFRYRHRLFGPDAARLFADRYLAELARFTAAPGSVPLAS